MKSKPETAKLSNPNLTEFEKKNIIKALWLYAFSLILNKNMFLDYIGYLLRIL